MKKLVGSVVLGLLCMSSFAFAASNSNTADRLESLIDRLETAVEQLEDGAGSSSKGSWFCSLKTTMNGNFYASASNKANAKARVLNACERAV
ncbi:MAG: hypothetical protein J6Y94_00860, partial [Bacteriovoracaceae bacterium]|nr:hypothetical protein [Bacteriovoracaceae bacterium]